MDIIKCCIELQHLHPKVKNTVSIDKSSTPNADTGLFVIESIPAQIIVIIDVNLKDMMSCIVRGVAQTIPKGKKMLTSYGM